MQFNFTPNVNFFYYLYWVKERMNIFWRKQAGKPDPWTDDSILQEYKFTNVYRMLDRASQYMLRHVIYNGNKYTDEQMFWRIIIYKHFNSPKTWDWLIKDLGDVDQGKDFRDITDSINRLAETGSPVYSNAYVMAAGFMATPKSAYYHLRDRGWKKHQYYFHIFEQEMYFENFAKCTSIEELYNEFMKINSFANFLAYQYPQDLNYSEIFNFDMNSFCAAGVGTQRGIERTFDLEGKKIDYGKIVVWVYENFDDLVTLYSDVYDVDLSMDFLPNFRPQVPDLANCFCETDKYLRGMGISSDRKVKGKRIKAGYTPNAKPINYIFPPKWNIKL